MTVWTSVDILLHVLATSSGAALAVVVFDMYDMLTRQHDMDAIGCVGVHEWESEAVSPHLGPHQGLVESPMRALFI